MNDNPVNWVGYSDEGQKEPYPLKVNTGKAILVVNSDQELVDTLDKLEQSPAYYKRPSAKMVYVDQE